MMNVDLNEIANAYLRNREEDFWAWEKVMDTVRSGDLERAWEVTLSLLQRAKTDDELNYVAAGPLEDLVDIYGDAALDRVEEAANSDSRIQVALSQIGVLFYYNEFERWYNLLYRYGLQKERVGDSSVIGTVMNLIESYVNDKVNAHQFCCDITGALHKPLDDKAAQRVLQSISENAEFLDAKRPPDYREPYLTEPELKRRAAQALAELQSLGYAAR